MDGTYYYSFTAVSALTVNCNYNAVIPHDRSSAQARSSRFDLRYSFAIHKETFRKRS